MTGSDNCKAVRLMADIHAQTCSREDCEAAPKKLVSEARVLLCAIESYLDDRADVDEPAPGRRVPNEEMRLLTWLRTFLAGHGLDPGTLLLGHTYVPCPKHGGFCWAGSAIDERACHQIVSGGSLCGQPEQAHISPPSSLTFDEHEDATEER